LSELFADQNAAFPVVQQHVRDELYSASWESRQMKLLLDREWVDSGTQDWSKFNSFAFGSEGVEVTFQPYQVSAYALGHHVVTVPYAVIATLMRPELLSAVDGDHFLYGR
jgi:hypothetical protein